MHPSYLMPQVIRNRLFANLAGATRSPPSDSEESDGPRSLKSAQRAYLTFECDAQRAALPTADAPHATLGRLRIFAAVVDDGRVEAKVARKVCGALRLFLVGRLASFDTVGAVTQNTRQLGAGAFIVYGRPSSTTRTPPHMRWRSVRGHQ
jgi:hypothetical protein